MDALAGLLDGPRAQGAFLLRAVLGPPWSLRIADEAPLAIFAVLEGDAWLVHPGTDGPVHLEPGDTVVARGPDHYTVEVTSKGRSKMLDATLGTSVFLGEIRL